MSWTEKYWDIIDQLYWTPKYLGLHSINRKYWEDHGDRISIPKDMTHKTGPLYRRGLTSGEHPVYVRRQEEIFNNIFDIVFGILPGDITSEIFCKYTNSGKKHNYVSLGKEIRQRYGWGKSENITQPDGFFVDENSILGVEIKFNAKTSLDQVTKYLMLFVLEQTTFPQTEKEVDLLFIFNKKPASTFKKNTGVNMEEINSDLYQKLYDSTSNKRVKEILSKENNTACNILDRMTVNCIDWNTFISDIENYINGLGEDRGERTIKNVLQGLVHETRAHPLSNI